MGLVTAVPAVIERWLSVINGGRIDDLDDLLADDVVFYSPAVFTPQQGREKTGAYLRAAEHVFSTTDFHYVQMWFGEQSAVLEFAAVLDGVTVQGIDMVHWNDEDKITAVKVMVRPLKALQALMPRMAERLAGH